MDEGKIAFFVIFGIIVLGLFFSSFYSINAGERGVLLTFGEASDDIKQPGLHLKVPIVQQIKKMDVRTLKYTADASSASKDLQIVQTEVVINYSLSPSEVVNIYTELGYSYEVLIDDMTKYYQERNKRSETEMRKIEGEMKDNYNNGGFGFGSMGGYYTFDEVIAELDTMKMLFPNLITEKDSIGGTLEGRTIWAVKISDNPNINESEPEVFYNSLTHAREPAGMMAVIYFMYH